MASAHGDSVAELRSHVHGWRLGSAGLNMCARSQRSTTERNGKHDEGPDAGPHHGSQLATVYVVHGSAAVKAAFSCWP